MAISQHNKKCTQASSKMSIRTSGPERAKKEPKAPGMRSDGHLPVITHTGWREWESTMATLQEHFRDTYQDLHTIFPDPMRITFTPAYKDFIPAVPSREELGQFNEENDPRQDGLKFLLDTYKEKRGTLLKLQSTHMVEREKAYHLIRSLCTSELNAVLTSNADFNEVPTDDPLGLLQVIKSVVTARCDGDIDLERSQALQEWYSLAMQTSESITTYGRRAAQTYTRLTTVGVPAGQLPTAKQQGRRFIDGLHNLTPSHTEYKNYLRHTKDCTGVDLYPKTLVEAINGATLWIRGAKATATPAAGFYHTALGARETNKPGGPLKGPRDTKPTRESTAIDKGQPIKWKRPADKPTKDRRKETKFEGECFKCGKIGHRAIDCRSKAQPPPNVFVARNVAADQVNDNKSFFYTTFGHQEDDNVYNFERQVHITIQENEVTQESTLGPESAGSIPLLGPESAHSSVNCKTTQAPTISSRAIFDTGATGTIISCEDVLSDVESCNPIVYQGLHGSLTVNKAGQLGDIGIVHFDPRAEVSIVSASDCLRLGHQWEFRKGDMIDQDAFLLHTENHTYKFQHCEGLYINDLAVPPEERYADAPTIVTGHAHPAVVRTPPTTFVYANLLATTSGNEENFTKREVQRSITARQFQASLGFPPDQKLIAALRAGSFLNCDILPEDIIRANEIWGTNVASLKGRTTRARPLPAPQLPVTRRNYDDQHMHCDIMFVNKQAYLVSITHPLGIVLVACVENLTTPILRQAIRRMFGTIGSRRIAIVKFTSDNERGIAALFGDMNAMGVEVVTVGPGQHDHIIERMIRTLKETIRSMIHSLPYLVPDSLMQHLVLSAGKKMLLFPSATRTDRISPFEAFFGRKADSKKDIGPPFGTYCQVTTRVLSNGMEPRTLDCLYLEPAMNGTGTHKFLRLDLRTVISANHYVTLPIPPTVTATVTGWASKNKLHTSQYPQFTFHDRNITDDADESVDPTPAKVPDTRLPASDHPHPSFDEDIQTSDTTIESPIAPDQFEIRGDMEDAIVEEYPSPTPGEVSGPEDTGLNIPNEIPEAYSTPPAHVRTSQPAVPVEMREKSTRIRKPVDRLNLWAAVQPSEAVETTGPRKQLLMAVPRALKLFPEKTAIAIASEVKSLLSKGTFTGVHSHDLTSSQRKKTLRSIMNVVEKYLPTLNSQGDRELEKVKARLCVDGRAQSREDYRPDEVESPTASIASIFSIAQIAAAEKRFVMVGDVGTAYLNAKMPMDNPDKILHMIIAKHVAEEIIRQDASFKEYRRQDGGLLVRLNKALYGCIESAKLWYTEIANTLQKHGFSGNPRDPCVFNKTVRGNQVTILIYVDDLKMTSVDKEAVLEVEQFLRKEYGQFRTSQEKIVPYLGCTWDYNEPGFVKVLQIGMIQDLVQAREKTHEDRGTKLTGIPRTPGASYLFEHSTDSTLLCEEQAKIFHTQVATLLYLSNHTRPDTALVTGELCKRVKAPTEEDDRKLDRVISYLRSTRDCPLRLGCNLPPKVTVSIDAAFANREMMKSTSGMCITLGVGNFIVRSKVQKLNSKSSTEAEIIAVSDGMNIPLWLADFLHHQGYKKHPIRLEQDNQSCITLLTKGRSTAETTRFIEIRKFWISDYIRTGEVDIQYVPTEDMTSDYLTKPVQGAVFTKLVKKIMGI